MVMPSVATEAVSPFLGAFRRTPTPAPATASPTLKVGGELRHDPVEAGRQIAGSNEGFGLGTLGEGH
jgi:hypothetical protein